MVYDTDDDYFSEWCLAICSVVFDIDRGQLVECCYPSAALSAKELAAIAFHAFPDSMSMEMHSRSSVRDSTFFFRIRRCVSPHAASGGRGEAPRLAGAAAAADEEQRYDSEEAEFLYGFVYCRQRTDERLRRGGEQKSVVVLATVPHSSVLRPLSQHAGALYFNRGPAALAEVYAEVLDWEPPTCAGRPVVALGGVALPAAVAASALLPPPARGGAEAAAHPADPLPLVAGANTPRGAFFEVDVWTPLREVAEQAWVLWELAVLAQPLLVVAPSPGECSATVAALVALVTPLPFAADFRPYFTIHDPAFARMAGGQLPSGANRLPCLLGITNLYILKAVPAWPNVLSTGTRPAPPQRGGAAPANGSAAAAAPPASEADRANGSPGSGGIRSSGIGVGRLARLNAAMRKRAVGAQALLTEHIAALWLAYKPLTRPDRALLERMVPSTERDSSAKAAAAANTAALRRHFAALTAALLAPFAPYLEPAPPPPGNAPVPLGGPPHLPAFSHAAFLEALPRAALSLVLTERFASQAALVAFYRRLLESPNFLAWFERRRGAAWAWQAAEWVEAARERGEGPDVAGRPDVEMVEAFSEHERRLEAALAAARAPASPPEAAARVAALRRGLGALFAQMPRDLQQAILSVPSRAALLHPAAAAPALPGVAQVQRRGSASSLGSLA
ncbi:hypothetical protein WJX81_007718 [Elliptochloris bilobata]|uniref:UDENN domain-containing protein n=1 Tax=Elliptochloris bilobata TaxID=381761 RepID=A0AAW1REN5_9CHLO